MKIFNKNKFLNFPVNKQLKEIYILAVKLEAKLINNPSYSLTNDVSYLQLELYTEYLLENTSPEAYKTRKEFNKIRNSKNTLKALQFFGQFLERQLDFLAKESDFLFKNDLKDATERVQLPIRVICDHIRSAHNFGSIIRTTECFGGEGIHYSHLTPAHSDKSVSKVTMGTEEFIEFEMYEDLYSLLEGIKKNDGLILALEKSPQSININEIPKILSFLKQSSKGAQKSFYILIGNEQYGLTQKALDLSDYIFSIELFGRKNSLNVSHALAILLEKLTHNLKNKIDREKEKNS